MHKLKYLPIFHSHWNFIVHKYKQAQIDRPIGISKVQIGLTKDKFEWSKPRNYVTLMHRSIVCMLHALFCAIWLLMWPFCYYYYNYCDFTRWFYKTQAIIHVTNYIAHAPVLPPLNQMTWTRKSNFFFDFLSKGSFGAWGSTGSTPKPLDQFIHSFRIFL